ncbi:MFS transporter [Roseomonas sp. CECT 9278]|uniref:MFS transporter n=1 Tax=Roseomonas sp. CECT 9278 TaxID=2845823 RepID=UPI001E2DA0D4|nr:MFS transporter [Roseomonas sp. CECT 9278]
MTPVVLALGVTQVIGYGTLYYAYAILAPAVAAEFGTTTASLYAVFSVGLLAGGLAAPRIGLWMDRFGAPRLMAAGSLLVGLLLGALAAAPGFWSFAACVVAIEVVGIAVLYDAAFATLAQQGHARARRAITHLTLIGGFASTLFWPLSGWAVEAVGWRGTYLAYALLHLAVALPLHAWIMRRPPVAPAHAEATGRHPPPWTPLEGRAARLAFWAFGLSFALSGMLGSALTIHLVPVLQALDLGSAAYAVAMLMGPAQVLIRLADALFWGARHPLGVALVSAAALPLAVLALLAPVPAVLAGIVFAMLFGFGQGLSSIVRGTVPLALFGPDGFGARLGRLAAIRTILGAAAPFVFAVGSERFGVTAALWASLLAGAAALAPLVLLHLRVVPRGGRLPAGAPPGSP